MMKHKRKEADAKLPGAEFIMGALAAVGAGFFTNPIEVIKIRLQLQGELEVRGSYDKIYKNSFHAAYAITKHEGIFALQTGLVPALAFQVVLNGIRLGVFNTAKRYDLMLNDKGSTSIIKTALVTGTSGSLASVIGSPLYMIKTQIQAQSIHSKTAVGHQHGHTGAWSAFVTLWKTSGVAGLYRGWYANVPRVFVGSATQLTTFSLATDWLESRDICRERPVLLTFLASAIGGTCVAVTMQPFDVLATRLYNQGVDTSGRGSLYDGLFDAIVKISKTEGLFGLYKGVFPTWMRIAPHTVLCLVFYKKLDELYIKLNT